MSIYKASIYNYLFNSINAIVVIINGIVMVPIYFHYMSVSTYGAWLASGNLVAMIGLLESGFASVITQKMASAINSGDRRNYLTLVGSNIMTAIIMACIIFLLGSCLIPFISKIVNADVEWAHDITIAYTLSLLSSAIAILVSLFGAFPQVWQETRQVGMINTIVNVFAIGVMVICLISGLGVISLAIGYISRSCLNLIFQGLWIMRHWNQKEIEKPIFNLNNAVSLLKECVYPLFARVSNVVMGQSQSLVLAIFIAPSTAAIYDITSKVFCCAYGFVSMANGSFFALLSLVFSKNNRYEVNRVVGNIVQYFTVIVITVFVFGIFFSQTIVYYWVGLDKYGGNHLLLAIGISLLTNQYKSFFNNLLFTSGNIKKSSIIDICSLGVYIALLLALIKALSIYSIPVAMLLTNLIFGIWYVNTLLRNTSVEVGTITRPLIKNFFISLPFICLYFFTNIPPYDVVGNVVEFILYLVVFTLLVFAVNPSIRSQFKIKTLNK